MSPPSGDLYREALEAVREALDIPHAATDADDGIRTRILADRLSDTTVFLGIFLELTDDKRASVGEFHISHLRRRLAAAPVTGYRAVRL